MIHVYTNVLINFGLLSESWEGGTCPAVEGTLGCIGNLNDNGRVYRELE